MVPMPRIVCISQSPVEPLKRILDDQRLEVINWPNAGLYGEEALEKIDRECANLADLSAMDCIICEEITAAPLVFKIRQRGYNGPLMLVPHINPYPLRNFLHVLLFAQCWGPDDLIITGSTSSVHRYEQFFDMTSRCIATYGVDTDLFYPRQKSSSRKRFDLPDQRLLLYTGRLTADKNIGALLAASSSIRALLPETKLVICGRFSDGAYVRSLSKQLEQVVLLRDLDENELPFLYSAADLFVSCATSYYESSPRSPAESISCHTPVLVPDWDGFRDYVSAERGTLVPVDSLDVPLYEQSSYAMVNLPAFVQKAFEMLSTPSPSAFSLPQRLAFKHVAAELRDTVFQLVETRIHKSNLVSTEVVVKNPIVGEIKNKLNIDSIKTLFDLATCPVQILPKLDIQTKKELYSCLFGPTRES
jgi:glycosyltransferase involved in cell wall biosynthesis